MTGEKHAPAGMPGEEEVARVLAEALRQRPIPDDIWRGMVESFRRLEGKYHDYATGHSISTDAFRLARAAQALFAPILAEKERLEGENVAAQALRAIGADPAKAFRETAVDLVRKAKAAEARALAAEAALAGERERCASIAERISQGQAQGWYENPKKDACGGGIAASNTGMLIAAAIRAEGE